ncbi:hypothetical protein VPNG_10248 [Cytospora leucostoma]|uniref:Rhodopsin domain-containing protein n=1 Tax=Cytospora leucostoma TaxID=1230097 RepID=A0A423VFU0_9PEZI|nr:hypothetical protein VPNG_10248 [Cytospora leucostoma]
MQRYTSLAICTLTVNWALTFLGFLTMVAVYEYKRKTPGSFRVDDFLIFSAFVVGVVLVGLQTWAIVDEGQGQHQQDIPVSQVARAAKSLLVTEALWSIVNGLIRVAAGLSMRRMFSPTGCCRLPGLITMIMSAVLVLASILQVYLICRPFAAQWDPRVMGTCGDQLLSFTVLESAGLILDIAILAWPVAVVVFRLKNTTAVKITLILILDMGAVVLVITGLRMGALRAAVSPDFSYSQSYLSLLSAAGSMAGIICCASPAIWGLHNRRRTSPPARGRVSEDETCRVRNMEIPQCGGV